MELLGVRDRGGGAAELLAEGGVGDAVGLAGAVPGADGLNHAVVRELAIP